MKIGRNDPCSCGSGKKYKQCCEKNNKEGGSGISASNISAGDLKAPGQSELIEINNLSNTGKYEEAEVKLVALLERFPEYGHGWRLLGLTLDKQSKSALLAWENASRFLPNDLEMAYNYGYALKISGKFVDSVQVFVKILQKNPKLVNVYYELGNALTLCGFNYKAIDMFKEALKINPKLQLAFNGIGNAQIALGLFKSASDSFLQSLRLNPNCTASYHNFLFCLCYDNKTTPEKYLKEANKFGDLYSNKVKSPYKDWDLKKTNNLIRIGIVSGDLRNHPVGHFSENLFKEIDQSKFELFAYQSDPDQDELTDRIKPFFRKWTLIFNLNDAAASNIIYNDNIDILIDLSGHTSKNRLSLFSYKPAPVQASWLGYFASTGMKEIDYFIADQYTIPTNIEEGYFREKILKLPDSYLCFTEPKFDVNVSDLPSLVNNYITFGCLNNITKVNDDVIKLWSTILNSVVNSKLFLKSMQLNDESFCDIVRNKFIKHGVDGDRLILEAFSPRIDILRTYQKIDIALDPFPYPGGTTSVEALWMGVPLLTKIGSNFLSRLGESLMMNVSMPEWIAQDDEDYVKKAIEHSSSIDKLREIRMGLRQKAISSPLFDSKRFARNFEDAMFKIWNDKLKEKGIV